MRGERSRSIRASALSLPWLHEAIGTAEWTGTPLWPLIEEAGPTADAIELVFRGADRGFQNEDEHDYGRSLSLAEARRPEVMLAYAMNGEPLQPQHGFPLRLLVPGWYGMTSVKWLTRSRPSANRSTGTSRRRLPLQARRRRPGRARHATPRPSADRPRPGPRLLHAATRRGGRPIASPVAHGPARAGRACRGRGRRRWHDAALGVEEASSRGVRGRSGGTQPSANTSCRAAPPTPRGTPSRSTHRGTSRVTATTRSSASASPFAEGAASMRSADTSP